MSAPSEDPPSQPPTSEKPAADVAPAAAPAAATSKPEDVEMPAAEEPDRFEDVPESVLKVCLLSCHVLVLGIVGADILSR